MQLPHQMSECCVDPFVAPLVAKRMHAACGFMRGRETPMTQEGSQVILK
jgi:hypothetical protein